MKINLKLSFKHILYLILVILILYTMYPYFKPVDYEFSDIATINSYDNDMQSIYSLKIKMSSKHAFLPNNDIDIKADLKIIQDDFWNSIKDQKDIRLFFLGSFENGKSPNSNKGLPDYGKGAEMMFSKKINVFGDRIEGFFNEDEIGQIVLKKIGEKTYKGSGKITYKAPGSYGYLLAFNRGHIEPKIFEDAQYKIYLDKIQIGSTTDLMIMRTNTLVLFLMIINIILICYFEIFFRKK